MNCKPGDLAVIKPPYKLQEMLGRFVEVIRAGVDGESVRMRSGQMADCRGPGGVGWLCESHGDEFPCFIGDAYLRPIRDQDGPDETLAWKAVPAPSVMTPKPQLELT